MSIVNVLVNYEWAFKVYYRAMLFEVCIKDTVNDVILSGHFVKRKSLSYLLQILFASLSLNSDELLALLIS